MLGEAMMASKRSDDTDVRIPLIVHSTRDILLPARKKSGIARKKHFFKHIVLASSALAILVGLQPQSALAYCPNSITGVVDCVCTDWEPSRPIHVTGCGNFCCHSAPNQSGSTYFYPFGMSPSFDCVPAPAACKPPPAPTPEPTPAAPPPTPTATPGPAPVSGPGPVVPTPAPSPAPIPIPCAKW